MPYAERQRDIPPTATDTVDIGAADTAALNQNVNIVVFKRLGFKLVVGS